MDTLTISPSEIDKLETSFNTTVFSNDSMVERRTANRRISKKSFTFRWSLLTSEERTSLQSFFELQGGKFKRWVFTDTRLGTSDPVYLRFDSDSIMFESIKHKAFNAEIKVTTC